MPPERRRWSGLSRTTEGLLAVSPDENDCLDLKAIAQPLTDHYLATMANAAALRGEGHATVLVGVGERNDPTSGITTGEIAGLTGDLHQAGETISQRASMTKPSLVRIEIFEENVDSAPILRVEIIPTMPLHYDQAGRRSTRQHTTTRAMSDEEILQLLEARELRRYSGVAEDTANLMMGDFRVVTDEVMERIERQQLDSDDVASRLQELMGRIDDVEFQLLDLPRDFDPADPESMEHSRLYATSCGERPLIRAVGRVSHWTPE